MTSVSSTTGRLRRRLSVQGIVQGVGFRPFVYRLANELQLAGFVQNDSSGVTIEIEGHPEVLDRFVGRLRSDSPPLSRLTGLSVEHISADGGTTFAIIGSKDALSPQTIIPPDIATCDDCLRELFDPTDRRFHYPLINCTNCGPRFTIVEGVPYDRPSTSMKIFPMCPACAAEYHEPTNRRFHTQPNACPACGPSLTLMDGSGNAIPGDPIDETVRLLRAGKILAVRGVGGFHLACDPTNDTAVSELRRRKGRAEKPFALMAPSLDSVRKFCDVSTDESTLLCDYRRPIVLLRAKTGHKLSGLAAPGNPFLGFMLAYSPLHHLLLRGNFDALIMTSGNFAEEPIAIGCEEALERLAPLADYFLLHDREILQRCDDSIMRIASGSPRLIRRARGFVPEPVFLKSDLHRPTLAVGGELKNTVALGRNDVVFLSQHIGDLDNPSALGFFEHCMAHLKSILGITPELIACDLHPEYLSTKWAAKQGLKCVQVQHHHAHLVSVMAENGVSERTIGIILDGTGYGTDGTIWGGEVLVGDAADFERFAWLAPVPMPGRTAAIRQPWRMALAYLQYAYGDDFRALDVPLLNEIPATHRDTVLQAITRHINSPLTSSCGRLFDGIAAILGTRNEVTFEAQAAMELEFLAHESKSAMPGNMPVLVTARGPLDFRHLIRTVVEGIARDVHRRDLAHAFHVGLVELFLKAATAARQETDIKRVALSGGVYQNLLFFEEMVRRLREEQFEILTHVQVPTNDGGLALGQIVAANAMASRGSLGKKSI
ncbi:MAG: carbamoyltransferase HypF [Candidatus Zixiibacteriota bacterium]